MKLTTTQTYLELVKDGTVVAPLGELDGVNAVVELDSGGDMLALLPPVGVGELATEGEVVPEVPADPDVEFVNVGNAEVLLGELDRLVRLDEPDVVLVGIAELRAQDPRG